MSIKAMQPDDVPTSTAVGDHHCTSVMRPVATALPTVLPTLWFSEMLCASSVTMADRLAVRASVSTPSVVSVASVALSPDSRACAMVDRELVALPIVRRDSRTHRLSEGKMGEKGKEGPRRHTAP